MTLVRVESFTISIDGFGAGPSQDLDNPLGVGGMALHEWLFATRTFQQNVMNAEGGELGIDDDFAARGFKNVGAWIIGRNMFGPVRGPWLNTSWCGWWGDSPPFHVPVFVLTNYERPPLKMNGDTSFHFVTGGIRKALELARASAGGKDVRIGGGTQTVQQYLRAGLIDKIHLAVVPTVLGSGERLFEGVNLKELGYVRQTHRVSEKATHIVLSKDTRDAA